MTSELKSNGAESKRVFKVAILGDGGVGKTAWIQKIRTKYFKQQYNATMGVEVTPVNIGNYIFNCWDCGGQEKLQGLKEGYCIGADAIIIMFDVTNKSSYKNAISSYREHFKVAPNVPIVLVGNKIDCKNYRAQQHILKRDQYGEDYTTYIPNCIAYIPMSVKENTNIDNPFVTLIEKFTGQKFV